MKKLLRTAAIVLACLPFVLGVIYVKGKENAQDHEDAVKEGRQAFRNGFSDGAIPYDDYKRRKWWLEGWIKEKRGE